MSKTLKTTLLILSVIFAVCLTAIITTPFIPQPACSMINFICGYIYGTLAFMYWVEKVEG